MKSNRACFLGNALMSPGIQEPRPWTSRQVSARMKKQPTAGGDRDTPWFSPPTRDRHQNFIGGRFGPFNARRWGLSGRLCAQRIALPTNVRSWRKLTYD
jgi:hypothetical protein